MPPGPFGPHSLIEGSTRQAGAVHGPITVLGGGRLGRFICLMGGRRVGSGEGQFWPRAGAPGGSVAAVSSWLLSHLPSLEALGTILQTWGPREARLGRTTCVSHCGWWLLHAGPSHLPGDQESRASVQQGPLPGAWGSCPELAVGEGTPLSWLRLGRGSVLVRAVFWKRGEHLPYCRPHCR